MAPATSHTSENVFHPDDSWVFAGPDDPQEDGSDAVDDEASSQGAVVVPQVDESERRRIRQSNDRDQTLERQGETAPHNEGYDDAAKGGTRR